MYIHTLRNSQWTIIHNNRPMDPDEESMGYLGGCKTRALQATEIRLNGRRDMCVNELRKRNIYSSTLCAGLFCHQGVGYKLRATPPRHLHPPRKKEKKKKRGYDRKEEGQKPVAGELKECCCEWVYIYGLHIYRMYVK